jgi:hypothetical protein
MLENAYFALQEVHDADFAEMAGVLPLRVGESGTRRSAHILQMTNTLCRAPFTNV